MTGKGGPSTFHRKYMEKDAEKFIRMYYGTQDRPFRFSLGNVSLEWRQAGRWLEQVTQSRGSKDSPKWCCSRWCCSGGPGMPQPFPRRSDRPVSPLTLYVTQCYFQFFFFYCLSFFFYCLSGSELSFCCLQSQNSNTRARMILHIKEQINKGNGQ